MFLLDWQTRTLAEFIAASVPTDKGKTNKLLEQASKVSLLDMLEEAERPAKVVAAELDDPIARAARRNKPGSFEALQAGFRPAPR